VTGFEFDGCDSNTGRDTEISFVISRNVRLFLADSPVQTLWGCLSSGDEDGRGEMMNPSTDTRFALWFAPLCFVTII
jgi:hypothetical protein